jgi:heptosyltransferase-2
MPLVMPGAVPEFGVIFRPLDKPAADAFVKASRERFGMRLLSRKEGFAEALKILRRRGLVGVLFDQNAGLQGALTTLFGRVCSTTELPGLMAEKFGARVYGLFPRRRGFWRVEVDTWSASTARQPPVTLGLNRWLEDLLRPTTTSAPPGSGRTTAGATRTCRPAIRLEAKRNLLAADLAARGLSALPRRTRIFVRLPNWLGDVVMALPLLRAILRAPPRRRDHPGRQGRLPAAARRRGASPIDLVALPPRGLGYCGISVPCARATPTTGCSSRTPSAATSRPG